MAKPPSFTCVRLRKAAPPDVDAIIQLEKTSFSWAPEDAFDRRQIRRLIGNPRAIVRVAVGDGGILAWSAALLRRHAAHVSGRIYTMAVHPQAQGLGLGKRMIRDLLRHLRAARARRVYLEVDSRNHRAIALYEKSGFTKLAHISHYYAVGRHAVRMVRQ